MATSNFPLGFKFVPTDYEIIAYYLAPKVQGLLIPGDIIVEEKVYTTEPKSLNWNHVPHLFDHERYYYVKRVQKSCKTRESKRAKRTLESDAGFWRLSTGEREILDPQGCVVGVVSLLNFWAYKDPKSKDRDRAEKTHWLMHEYKLHGDQFQEWVICRIKDKMKDPKKINKIIRESVVMAPQLPEQQNQLPLDHHDQPSHDHHHNSVDVPMLSLPVQDNDQQEQVHVQPEQQLEMQQHEIGMTYSEEIMDDQLIDLLDDDHVLHDTIQQCQFDCEELQLAVRQQVDPNTLLCLPQFADYEQSATPFLDAWMDFPLDQQ